MNPLGNENAGSGFRVARLGRRRSAWASKCLGVGFQARLSIRTSVIWPDPTIRYVRASGFSLFRVTIR